jgi:hypothetical protein
MNRLKSIGNINKGNAAAKAVQRSRKSKLQAILPRIKDIAVDAFVFDPLINGYLNSKMIQDMNEDDVRFDMMFSL